MARIRGHYEWDDDALTPGRRRDGGLHQNLFDSNGELRAHARFIPETGRQGKPRVTETVFITVDERREDETADWLQEIIAELMVFAVTRGMRVATPIAQQWWRETARPAIGAQRDRLVEGRVRRRARRNAPAVEGDVADTTPGRAGGGPEMSFSEAQARYLAALAARAYSAEQMRLVESATIVGAEGLADVEQALSDLDQDDLRRLLETMATNPALLEEAALAGFASRLEPSSRPASTELEKFS